MTRSRITQMLIDMPKLIIGQVTKPLRVAFRRPLSAPQNQQELAEMVNTALVHEIRAGYTHRFITLLFVTVEDRIFCRRYSYNEPSWHSIFLSDSGGQVKLDKTIVNIRAEVPQDVDSVIPLVDQAYEAKLAKIRGRFLLAGATDSRAQKSTLELILDHNAKTGAD